MHVQNMHTPLHKNKKWSFPLRISLVNVTKSAGNWGFGHIYWGNPQWKTSFFCAVETGGIFKSFSENGNCFNIKFVWRDPTTGDRL